MGDLTVQRVTQCSTMVTEVHGNQLQGAVLDVGACISQYQVLIQVNSE